MEQRPLRLGDIVDDYCPRERRITNHVIVALVGETIRQTRCTTCDADHVYKEAKVPRRKKTDVPVALDDQVLADASPAQLVPTKTQSSDKMPVPLAAAADSPDDPAVSEDNRDDRPGQDGATETAADEQQPETRSDEVWSAHRPLIRATLPRTEGEPPTPRPIPEFTMHQRRTRGGHGFRQNWQGNGGNGFSGNGFRPGGGRSAHGQGQGQGHGNGPGHGRHESGGRSGRRHGSKNKRSR
jgi:hypothetical protein